MSTTPTIEPATRFIGAWNTAGGPASQGQPWRAGTQCAMLASPMLAMRSGRGALRVAVVAVVCVCALATASRADASWRFELGIGDQGLDMFSDPRFTALGLEHLRVVLPYDVACRPGPAQHYADTWLAAARSAGARPL